MSLSTRFPRRSTAAMNQGRRPARALLRVRPDPQPHQGRDRGGSKALAAEPALAEVAPFSKSTVTKLDAVVEGFLPADGEAVKAIEATTNHDVKAVEYWLKKRFADNVEVQKVSEFIHFACTSEDINNTSHALMLADARAQVMLPARCVDQSFSRPGA